MMDRPYVYGLRRYKQKVPDDSKTIRVRLLDEH